MERAKLIIWDRIPLAKCVFTKRLESIEPEHVAILRFWSASGKLELAGKLLGPETVLLSVRNHGLDALLPSTSKLVDWRGFKLHIRGVEMLIVHDEQ